MFTECLQRVHNSMYTEKRCLNVTLFMMCFNKTVIKSHSNLEMKKCRKPFGSDLERTPKLQAVNPVLENALNYTKMSHVTEVGSYNFVFLKDGP